MTRLIEPSTTPSLLLAAREGSPEAWNRFVHLYGPLVYRWVRRAGLQSSDAADVTQEVLVSVSKDLRNFDLQRPGVKFRAWLWTITRRRIADGIRQRGEEQLMGSAVKELEAWSESAEPPTDVRLDQRTLVRRAVAIYRDRFDPKTWQAFWATVVEGRDPSEVAETLGVSRWNVYKARARLLQRLRTELAGLLDEAIDHQDIETDMPTAENEESSQS